MAVGIQPRPGCLGDAIRAGASKSQLKTIVWTLEKARLGFAATAATAAATAVSATTPRVQASLTGCKVAVWVNPEIADRVAAVADELDIQYRTSVATGIPCPYGSSAYRTAQQSGDPKAHSVRQSVRLSGKAKHDFVEVAETALAAGKDNSAAA